MSINDIIIYVMIAFMLLGAIDRICGNRLGLGEEFEKGILTIGPLALSMLGIISLAPVLAQVLQPVATPLFRLFGADPGMLPGFILACDMGGAALALEMAETVEGGLFGGVIVGSMLGSTIVFTIPVALGVIKTEDRKFLAKGVLAGLVTIPVGCFVGGLMAGYAPVFLLKNLLPVLLFSLLIALGLWKAEALMIRGFILFGKFVTALITFGLAVAILEALTGFALIPGMAPLSAGYEIVGSIAIILAGAFPLLAVITRVFKKPLLTLGHLLGMNDVSAAGMIATLANSIPMFGMLGDMDERGKVLNVAFSVSAAFALGDHLGFTAGFSPELLFPTLVAKLLSGAAAVALGILLTRRKNA